MFGFVFTWVSARCSGKLLASLSRDVTGELKSLRLFDAGFALRW